MRTSTVLLGPVWIPLTDVQSICTAPGALYRLLNLINKSKVKNICLAYSSNVYSLPTTLLQPISLGTLVVRHNDDRKLVNGWSS